MPSFGCLHDANANIMGAIESDYNYRHNDSKVFVPQMYGKDIKKMCEDLLGEFDAHAGSLKSSLLAYYGH